MRLTSLGNTPALDWERLSPALRECGEIAAMRLSQALADAVLNASNKLLDQASQALTPSEREAWLDAADLARALRFGLGQEFMRHFQTGYARACRQDTQAAEASGHVSGLELAGHAPEAGFMSRFRQYVAWDGLAKLSQCYASLLNNPGLEPMYSPVGPMVIQSALDAGLRAQPGADAVKQRLVDSMHREFLGRVNLLYRDLTSFMIALGFVGAGALSRSGAETFGQGAPETARETPTETTSPEVAADADPLAGLVPGTWIEYRKSGKTPHPLRLSWASPKRSLYLWTTAEGGRTLCVSAEELAAAFASGRARRIEIDAGVDTESDAETALANVERRKSA
jgi:hypothetical protein